MGQKSTIERLPDDILSQLQQWIKDNNVTQLQATELVNQLLEKEGLDTVSKSAVNRYAIKMKEIGRKIFERREMAQMLTSELGKTPDGEAGQLLIEIVRNLTYDTVIGLDDAGDASAKEVKELAMAIKQLEDASTINAKRQAEIEKAALEKAAKDMESEAKKQGVSDDIIAKLRDNFLGAK